MKTVGELLREERQKQRKTLEQIAEITKIRPSMLEHLENGEYDQLPSKTYVQGFVRAYAQALKLDLNKALAFFRREYDLKASQERLPPQPINKAGFIITPTKVASVVGIAILLLFFGFLFWQFRQFAGKPVLIVDYPPDQISIQKNFVNVSGKTDPDVSIVINGEQVPVNQDGTFQITVELSEGINTVTVTAHNSIGKETIIEREVRVNLDDGVQ
ncbi:helix-turn-helix domain-containing protein [candidate division WWE3 bacterium]|uniref:Helix-turn-helix domain-containing protein n=1 Tax=candidate division WWE3 bacterium TaxID=2053526 RepID=A0A955LG84_UNCKA|nr:helix-turn-helix domain-containing protein [candidate division WWE3 bacterium]